MPDVKCPRCGHQYNHLSLQWQEIVITGEGLPAFVCEHCHTQVPLAELEKQVVQDKKPVKKESE